MPHKQEHHLECLLLRHAMDSDPRLRTSLNKSWDDIETQLNNPGKEESIKALFNHSIPSIDQEVAAKRCQRPYCSGCHAAAWILLFNHFIECWWGACYNTTSDELIAPNFCSPALLHAILRSSMIRDTPDVLHGHEGARVFPELLSHLRKIKDPSVEAYLTSFQSGNQQ
jgi:hypothetical protein